MARPLLFLALASLAVATGASAATSKVVVEEPFLLGDKPLPPKQGELGPLVGDRPPEAGHHAPRVIVDVLDARGMKKKEAEAAARAGSWGKVVACYRKKAWSEPDLEVDTKLRVSVSKSAIKSARLIRTKSKDAVETCLAKALVGVAMPKTRRTATATIQVRVFPGDDPVPPPEEMVEKGAGSLDLSRAKAVVEAATPDFRSCHEQALAYAPKLWGNIAVRFRVKDDGTVSEAFEVGGPFPEERVTRCVLRKARTLRFDAPEGGPVRFVVPLSFKP